MAHHAFVAMPFGTKDEIDFDAVFRDLIKPALESAGFEVFRADEEMRAGNLAWADRSPLQYSSMKRCNLSSK